MRANLTRVGMSGRVSGPPPIQLGLSSQRRGVCMSGGAWLGRGQHHELVKWLCFLVLIKQNPKSRVSWDDRISYGLQERPRGCWVACSVQCRQDSESVAQVDPQLWRSPPGHSPGQLPGPAEPHFPLGWSEKQIRESFHATRWELSLGCPLRSAPQHGWNPIWRASGRAQEVACLQRPRDWLGRLQATL